MQEKEFKEKLFDIRMKIALLRPDERDNLNHPFYQELKKLKREYAETGNAEKRKGARK